MSRRALLVRIPTGAGAAVAGEVAPALNRRRGGRSGRSLVKSPLFSTRRAAGTPALRALPNPRFLSTEELARARK